ncbi:MAG: response regulator [Synergistaceae bacterium]|nr:response regulator [Synergistaceae bacterium]
MQSFTDRAERYLNKRHAEVVAAAFILVHTIITSFGAAWKLPIGLLLAAASIFANRWIDRQGTAAWVIPSALALVGTLTAAFGGSNRMYFAYLIGCGVISLTYLDRRSFFVYIGISNALAGGLILAAGASGARLANMWTATQFFGYDTICMMLLWSCSFFQGKAETIEKSGHTFETIMKTTPSYMAIINDKAEVEYISSSLAEWLGISHMKYAKYSALLDLLPTGDMKMMFQEIIEQGGYVERNFEAVVDNSIHWFVLRSSLLEEYGISRFFEWVDITPIMEAKNEAESATRAKSDFLANVSHEIRTPMNAIIGMTELTLSDNISSEQAERAMAIKTAAISLLNIVNDILDFSKIEARKMEIVSKPFDFSSFLNDLVNIVNIKANGEGIALTTRIARDMPAVVCLDDLRLRQCLVNLLNNAVKFTNKGCISLDAWSETLRDGRLKLSFSVKDTGVGIKREEISKLFNEFQQLDTHKNRNISGTGLGLAITRRLVELMEGEISVESVYNVGSTFSFFVICDRFDAEDLANIQIKGIRVLCYEPNHYHADALEYALKNFGVEHVVMKDLDMTIERLGKGGYTHVLFDASGKERVSAYSFMTETRFIMLKNVLDQKDPDFMDILTRPLLPTTLANLLNGRDKKETKEAASVAVEDLQTKDSFVLVVDDNPVNLSVAEGLLRRCGVNVETASGGQEAIEKASAAEYDIIFMDHMMPDVDGLDATKAIRALGARHLDSVIVALTANVVSDAREQFFLAGMNGFLAKPIIVSDLHDILLKFLPHEKIVKNAGARK